MTLTEKETKLIEFIRKLDYGELTIVVQKKEWVLIREGFKTIKPESLPGG